MEAFSQAGTGGVNITVTGSLESSIPLDFVDIVGLDGIEEDMKVMVPGLFEGGALPK